jgi:hypothetical protein
MNTLELDTLPHKLWQLLELAIQSAMELDPAKYTLDMAVWYLNSPTKGRCVVCMAGAVMVTKLGASKVGTLTPASFNGDAHNRLLAINGLRKGLVIAAHELVHDYIDVAIYNIDRNVLARAQACQEAPWIDNWSAHTALAAELKRLDL